MNHPISHRKFEVWELSTYLLSLEFSSQRNFVFHKPFSGFHTIVSLLFIPFPPLPNTFSMPWLQLHDLPFACIKILRKIHFSHWLQEHHTKYHHTWLAWSPPLAFEYFRCYFKHRFSFWDTWKLSATYWMLLQRVKHTFPILSTPSALVQALSLVELFLLDINTKNFRKYYLLLKTKGSIC